MALLELSSDLLQFVYTAYVPELVVPHLSVSKRFRDVLRGVDAVDVRVTAARCRSLTRSALSHFRGDVRLVLYTDGGQTAEMEAALSHLSCVIGGGCTAGPAPSASAEADTEGAGVTALAIVHDDPCGEGWVDQEDALREEAEEAAAAALFSATQSLIMACVCARVGASRPQRLRALTLRCLPLGGIGLVAVLRKSLVSSCSCQPGVGFKTLCMQETRTTAAALEHLHLESCGLGPRCSADLASIIHALCHTLKSIKLPGNSLDAAGVTLLAPALRECACLTSLDLVGNSIGSDGCDALAAHLSLCTTLTALDVRDNRLASVDGLKLAASLPYLSRLEEYAACGRSDGGMIWVGTQVGVGDVLGGAWDDAVAADGLRASGPSFGGVALVDAGCRLPFLWRRSVRPGEVGGGGEELDVCLESCGCGAAEAAVFRWLAAKMGHAEEKVRAVRAANNPLGAQGCTEILAMAGLEECSVRPCGTPVLALRGLRGLQGLGSLLGHGNGVGTGLKEVDVSGCQLGPVGATALAAVLGASPELERLRCARNRVQADGAAALSSALPLCPNLTSLNALHLPDVHAEIASCVGVIPLSQVKCVLPLPRQHCMGAGETDGGREGAGHEEGSGCPPRLQLDLHGLIKEAKYEAGWVMRRFAALLHVQPELRHASGPEAGGAVSRGCSRSGRAAAASWATLSSLDFRRNELGVWGRMGREGGGGWEGRLFCQILQECDGLSSLDLSCNLLDVGTLHADDVKALCRGICASSCLQRLSLAGNNLGVALTAQPPKESSVLARIVTDLTTLTDLNLAVTMISLPCMRELSPALRSLRAGLCRLNLQVCLCDCLSSFGCLSFPSSVCACRC